VNKSSNDKENVPFSPSSSANLLLAVPCREQKANGPQICNVYVAPRDTAWKKELATLEAELDAIGSTIGLEGKVVVNHQKEVQRHEAKGEIKAEVLLQKANEEIEIIRRQCDDLIELTKAKQKHLSQRQLQLSGEELHQPRKPNATAGGDIQQESNALA
jgi:hypothetical protein